MTTLTAEQDTMANYVAFSDGLKTGNPITDEFVGTVPSVSKESEKPQAPAEKPQAPAPQASSAQQAAPGDDQRRRSGRDNDADAAATASARSTRRRRPVRRIKDEPCRVEVHIDGSAYAVELPVGSIDEGLATLKVVDVLGHSERRLDGEHRRPPTQISELHNRARKWAQEQGMEVGNRGPVSWAMVKDYLSAQEPA